MSTKLASWLAGPVVLGVVAFANVPAAQAYYYGSYSVLNQVNVTITRPDSITEGGGSGQITLYGATDPNPPHQSFTGLNYAVWCLDIYDTLHTNGTYNLGSLAVNSSPGGSNPTLSATQINQIGSIISNVNLASSAYASSGVQLAIWEIEYGNTISFSTYGGNTTAFNGATNLATTYIANATAPGGSWYDPTATYNLTLFSFAGNQDLTFVGSITHAATTPLPAALPLFVSGIAGMGGLLGWRRKRRKAPAVAA